MASRRRDTPPGPEPEPEPAGAGSGARDFNFAGTGLAELVVGRRAGRRVSTPGYYGCNS
eukprot:SAG22_NODE_5194_length_1064_cov_13.964767_1_plen_58_part_10